MIINIPPLEKGFFYYFAYGSNMNDEQMKFRCPGSKKVCPAVLKNYKLVERKYADIEKCPNSTVDGLLWIISDENLKNLDRYEGYPNVYYRHDVTINIGKKNLTAIAYQMTPETVKAREGIKYSKEYIITCRAGALMNGIKSAF